MTTVYTPPDWEAHHIVRKSYVSVCPPDWEAHHDGARSYCSIRPPDRPF